MKNPQPKLFKPKSWSPDLVRVKKSRPFTDPAMLGRVSPDVKLPAKLPPVIGSKFDYVAAANKVAPYASNIINSFRKPPKPITPVLDGGVALQRADFSNDKAMVERGVRGANMAADKNLDENTGTAVKMSILASRFNQLSDVNSKERNANIGIGNEEAKIAAQVASGNTSKRDGYNNSLVERGVAIQRESSANIANVGDKIVAIQNEKSKKDLELKKQAILMGTDYRGTMGALKERVGFAMGGKIKSFNSKRMYTALK
jgi:hypothetical protein